MSISSNLAAHESTEGVGSSLKGGMMSRTINIVNIEHDELQKLAERSQPERAVGTLSMRRQVVNLHKSVRRGRP